MQQPDKLDVVIGIIERDGLYLVGQRLPKRPFPFTWEFPGGKVEPDDYSLGTALKRELKEELGIEAVIGENVHRCAFPGTLPSDEKRDIILHFYKVDGYAYTGKLLALDHIQLIWADEYMIKSLNIINSSMLEALEKSKLNG